MNEPNDTIEITPLLRPAQAILDKGVAQSLTAAALCEQLEGKSLLVSPGSEGLSVHFTVTDGRLLLKHGLLEDADATLQASPLNLLRLLGNDPQRAIRDGYVKVFGDADVAESYQTLLNIVRPDLEEELSKLTGDVVAHELGNLARGFRSWSQHARRSFGRSLSEYLTEESRDVVATTELELFCKEVDQLSAAVDRCEARLKLLRSRAENSD